MVSYALGYVGRGALWVAVAAALVAVVLFVFGHVLGGAGKKKPALAKAGGRAASRKTVAAPARQNPGENCVNLAYLLVFVVALSLFVSCAVIVSGFFTHNVAIQYVAQNYPTDIGSLFWLYQLSGLWASRAGSLLTWAFLIAVFAAWVAWHRRTETDDLSNMALMVVMVVLLFFLAVMNFSSGNNPFVLTDPSYIDADGNLTGSAAAWGMNVLLEHWAMALHPPTLFVGYAGMTIPFAYAVSALICNDPSKRWVDLCNRLALFAFIFLTVGIGLGAVWAYVVLGWGGYWGWDPVENASLLSWLTAVAMIHSFTVYRKRSMMKGWALVTAALTFFFVILGTFITRSGIVESVHAFSSDQVSTYSFMLMMLLTLLAVAVGYALRRKAFASEDDIESVVSKNGSYYLTNLIMVFSAVLIAYLTVASALPTWLPAGGRSVGATAYESVARPLGVVFCLLAAVCPFLAWKKTDGRAFWRTMRIPAVVAVVAFALLLVYFATRLYPTYVENIAQDDANAYDLASMGPSWYYNGLAVVALLVAALLAANSAYLVVRGTVARMRNKGENAAVALGRLFAKSPAQAGGYLTHLGLGIVLVGLVGSSMYVTDRTIAFSAEETGTATVGSYTLVYNGDESHTDEYGNYVYSTSFDVSRGDVDLGTMNPSLEATAASNYGQTRVNAEVRSSFAEDLFVAFQGYESDGSVVVNARVNPLISLVWIGFGVMGVGIVCATWPRRASSLTVVEGGQGTQGRVRA